MLPRTDLAIDINESINVPVSGVAESRKNIGDVSITSIKITDEEGERRLGKPKGDYITVEFPSLAVITDYNNLKTAVIDSLKSLIPSFNCILIAALGNRQITPDAVGPKTAENLLATRHISGQFADNLGLKGLKSTAVITPDVLGKTGIEACEIIGAAAKTVKPDVIIVIDALASSSVSRLFKTVQLSNTGISPGSGVKNSRCEISLKTVGVPVVAVGVPTVVDANTLAYELTGAETETDSDMLVTPKEVDLLSDRISDILSSAVNIFLQPDIDPQIIEGLV